MSDAPRSPDGRQVVTASLDDTARIFSCEDIDSLESLLEIVKRRVHRQLTDEERRLYLEN